MQSVAAKKIAIIVFLAGITLPLLAAMWSGQFIDTLKVALEKPAEWPRAKEILRRSTPLWTRAVENYTKLMYRLGSSPNQDIAVIGRDGFVFLGDNFNRSFSQASGRRVYSEQEVASWAETLKLQRTWLSVQGADMLFVVAPAKWSVYEDKLPAWVGNKVGERTFDKLLAVDGVLPTLIDVRPDLVGARSKAETYSPLNSHWTDYGAIVAWQRIAATLAEINPKYRGLYVPQYQSITVGDTGNEFESMIGLVRYNPWTMPVYKSALPAYEVLNDNGNPISVNGGARKTDLLDLPRRTRGGGAARPFRVLVMRDSMGNSLSPFLQAAFKETIQIDHKLGTPGSATDIVPLVRKYKPDLVIYIMTERYLDAPLGQTYRWRSLVDAAQAR